MTFRSSSHFSFQELDLSAEALVFNDSSREESWIKALEKSLPDGAVYTQVRKYSFLYVTCYAKKELRRLKNGTTIDNRVDVNESNFA